MNDKLIKIFQRDSFKVGDIMKFNIKDTKDRYEVLYIDLSMMYIKHNNGVSKELINTHRNDITLIQPFVSLSDVLEKMNEKELVEMTKSIRKDNVLFIINMETRFEWVLGKSLWEQGDDTRKAILDILEG